MKRLMFVYLFLSILLVACVDSSFEVDNSSKAPTTIIVNHETGLYTNTSESGKYLLTLKKGTELEPVNTPFLCDIYNADGVVILKCAM